MHALKRYERYRPRIENWSGSRLSITFSLRQLANYVKAHKEAPIPRVPVCDLLVNDRDLRRRRNVILFFKVDVIDSLLKYIFIVKTHKDAGTFRVPARELHVYDHERWFFFQG